MDQKDKVEKMDFFDEETFNEYLNELTALKKLENQKKFINYWSIQISYKIVPIFLKSKSNRYYLDS